MGQYSFQLVMQSGPTPGQVFALDKDQFTFGRDPGSDVVISDSEISRNHARMTARAEGYVLEDLTSTNGTYVNDQQLMGPHVLQPNDLIRLAESASFSFETAPFDADATQIGTPIPADVLPPPQPDTPQQVSPQPVPPPQPVPESLYSAQAHPQPVEPYPGSSETYPQAPEKAASRFWMYISCGILVLLLCVLLAAAVAFDQLNMYCEPPFNILFYCP